MIRAGKSVLPQPLPLILGSDLSGIVEAVGPAVTATTGTEAASKSLRRTGLAAIIPTEATAYWA